MNHTTSMKFPIPLRDSTPYFEKYFLLCEQRPDTYVSAYREACFESRFKQRREVAMAVVVTLLAPLAWLLGYVHLLFVFGAWGVAWGVTVWRIRHEKLLLDRTFQLALKGKDRLFQDQMWRYRERDY